MERVRQAAQLAVHINAFIHEAQRERGGSALYVQSRGTKFAAELPGQRKAFDTSRANLERYVRESPGRPGASWAPEMSRALSPLAGLASLRQGIDLVPSIAATASLVEQVAFASAEQSSGLRQVSQAMAQVGQVTQRNAAMAEELAGTAEELSAQAQELEQLLTFFQLAPGANGSSFGRRSLL
jgi:hypothetical protein